MGEQIPNTSYHIDKHIAQIYDTQKDVDKGTVDERYLIPNTTLTIIMANRKKLRRMETMGEQIPNT